MTPHKRASILRPSLRLVVFCALSCFDHAGGVDFSTVAVNGKAATVCGVNLNEENLELFLRDDAGHPLRSFTGVEAWLSKSGRKLVFAMNAGMFERDLGPVGLFVSVGKQIHALNLAHGPGNFFLKPNGVFLTTPSGARIVPSEEYPPVHGPVILATQSGPMLVIAGKINPRFDPNSTSRLFRNGVGVSSSGRAVFAIAEEPLNFYEFATLFRDVLHCQNALYFDGTVSSLYAPELGRNDRKIDLGPMIGVVK